MTKEKELNPTATEDWFTLIDAVDHIEQTPKVFDQTIHINFLRNFSIDTVEPFLKYYLYQSLLQPAIVFGNYDNVDQEILDHASTLHKSPPDLIVLALILEQMDPVYKLPAWTADEMKDRLETLYNHLLEKTSALIAVNTFPCRFTRDE